MTYSQIHPIFVPAVPPLPYGDTVKLLFGGIGAVLVLASSIAWLLRWRVAKMQPHGVLDNLVARINAWWVMIGVIGLSLLLGRNGVIVLFIAISAFALREYLRIAERHEADRYSIAFAYAVALPLQYYLIWINWYGLYSILLPVYGFLMLPILSTWKSDTSHFLARSATIQWGLMVCIYCLSHVPALLTLNIPHYEPQRLFLLIAYLVIVVQGSDVLQYIWGKLFGKHKVAPVLSPSKTWEGLIGGIASATALGAALYWITPFAPWQAALISLVMCLMGFFGGLVMSAIKRDRGIKDWGTLIAGHGGMLDRTDSIIFAAPVFFHITRYFWGA
ncbi:MAG: phosphatidate cytidylyltransferase [Brachymonas sp.]|nr:phosphatidate cytidylyltransferase [Brachymonas sp.]